MAKKIDKINVDGQEYDINLPTDANIAISSALINVLSATQDGFVVRGNGGDSTITIQPTSTTRSFDGSSYIRFNDSVNGFDSYILQDANNKTFTINSNYTNGILLSTYSATQPITFKQGSSTMKVPTTEGTHTLATTDSNWAASDITSGTFSIGRGGTGATTAAQARTNLGVQRATEYSELYISPSDGKVYYSIPTGAKHVRFVLRRVDTPANANFRALFMYSGSWSTADTSVDFRGDNVRFYMVDVYINETDGIMYINSVYTQPTSDFSSSATPLVATRHTTSYSSATYRRIGFSCVYDNGTSSAGL